MYVSLHEYNKTSLKETQICQSFSPNSPRAYFLEPQSVGIVIHRATAARTYRVSQRKGLVKATSG